MQSDGEVLFVRGSSAGDELLATKVSTLSYNGVEYVHAPQAVTSIAVTYSSAGAVAEVDMGAATSLTLHVAAAPDQVRFNGQSVMVIGHQKGRDTREKIARNFGMPHPEGYRKALRLMHLAQKFGKPVITFIDTPGAYPGLGAEERGQAEAIARNLREMAALRTPILSVVTGEGGSGGALAIGMGNRVLMLEYAIYSVISPEGCAAILWGDAGKAPEAAESMRITAPDLLRLGVIDAAGLLREALREHLRQLVSQSHEDLVTGRYEKFRKMGAFEEASMPGAGG